MAHLCDKCKKTPGKCNPGMTRTGKPKNEFLDSGDVAECDTFEPKEEAKTFVAGRPSMTEFERFQHSFLFWKQRLGLHSWKVLKFEPRPYKDSRAYATVNYVPEQRECWVYFYGSENDPEINVSDRALHEVLHLLLADCNVPDSVLHTIINTTLDLLHDKTISWELKEGAGF